jgi:hypothetical protein
VEPHGLEPRLSALESEVRDFRRATVASFNAMREDMVSMREYMHAMRDDMDNGFIEMRGKLDATAAGQRQIVELLNGLIADQG